MVVFGVDDTGAGVGPREADFPFTLFLLGDLPSSACERFCLDRSSWDSFEVLGRAKFLLALIHLYTIAFVWCTFGRIPVVGYFESWIERVRIISLKQKYGSWNLFSWDKLKT